MRGRREGCVLGYDGGEERVRGGRTDQRREGNGGVKEAGEKEGGAGSVGVP